jgi:hypothetical protein
MYSMKKVAALMMIGAAIFPLCAMFAIPAIGQVLFFSFRM